MRISVRQSSWVFGGCALLWVLTFLGARFLLDKDLDLQPAYWRIGAALLPVIPAILLLWQLIRGVSSMDELHRRVHLEALVIAFPLAILLLMTLGLLQMAIPLSEENWSYRHVWVYLPLFYFAGLAVAWRRYQ